MTFPVNPCLVISLLKGSRDAEGSQRSHAAPCGCAWAACPFRDRGKRIGAVERLKVILGKYLEEKVNEPVFALLVFVP